MGVVISGMLFMFFFLKRLGGIKCAKEQHIPLLQLIASFGEQFKKSHENLQKTFIFQSLVSDLDQKKCSKFCYCYTDLGAGCSTKETITAFHRAF